MSAHVLVWQQWDCPDCLHARPGWEDRHAVCASWQATLAQVRQEIRAYGTEVRGFAAYVLVEPVQPAVVAQVVFEAQMAADAAKRHRGAGERSALEAAERAELARLKARYETP